MKKIQKRRYIKIWFLGECLILILICVLIMAFHQIEKNNVEYEFTKKFDECLNQIYDDFSSTISEVKSGKTIDLNGKEIDSIIDSIESSLSAVSDEILYDVNNYDAENAGKLRENYGLAFRLYDKDGKILAQSHRNNLYVKWFDRDGNGPEYYFLEDYFEEKEIKKYLSWMFDKKVDGGHRQVWVDSMTGYKDEKNNFVPIEIIVTDPWNDANDIQYELVNKQKRKEIDKKNLIYRTFEPDPPQNSKNKEYGELYEDAFPTKKELTNDICKLFEANHLEACEDGNQIAAISDPYAGFSHNFNDFYADEVDGVRTGYYSVKHIENSVVAAYEYQLGADFDTIAWYTGRMKEYQYFIFFVCQFVGQCLICLYIILDYHKRKLNQTRQMFLNAIAHEMKSPAAVLLNSAECLEEGIHPEKHAHYLQIMKQESGHINELLGDMLVYTRVNDSSYKIQKEDCQIERLLCNILSHYTTIIEQKNVTVDWNCKTECRMNCDKKLMEMVFDNLISNAVKFVFDNGTICLTLDNRSIHIYNDGKTISKEDQKHIFDPLYKVDQAHTYEYGSSGMGLAISADILKLHKMKYGVENKETGVSFYIKW